MESSRWRIYRERVQPTLRLLIKSKYFISGLVLLIPLVVLGSIGPIFIPYESIYMGLYPLKTPPSHDHIFGTDVLGRDVFAVFVHSIGSSLQIGLLAGLLSELIGIFIGFVAGYKGGWTSDILMDVTNVFLIIPTWPLLVVIGSMVRGVSILILCGLIAAFSWTWGARIYRSQVLSLKEMPFVDVAKLSGLGDLEIVFKEILPNTLSWLGVGLAGSITWAMINEVSLEVIGLGPQGVTTLGIMLYWAIYWGSLYRGLWWCLFPPVFTLIMVFVGLQFLNIGMDQVFNPRLRD